MTRSFLNMECPICLENKTSLFNNRCGHSWCNECHEELLKIKHITCVICRQLITLHKPMKTKHDYVIWLLKGGQPLFLLKKKRKKVYKNY